MFRLAPVLLAAAGCLHAAVLSISPGTSNVTQGSTFTVDLVVDGDTTDLAGYQLSIAFDPAIILAQSTSEGALFADTGRSLFIPGTIDNGAGTVSLIFSFLLGPPGVDGPGTLASISFLAVGPGSSNLSWILEGQSATVLTDSEANPIALDQAQSALVNVSAIPEPHTVWLFAGGLVLMAGLPRIIPTRFRRRPGEPSRYRD